MSRGRKNEIVDHFPKFLAQGITQELYKMIINTITQIRDKKTNTKQDQIEFEE